ncbi:MAG TPA: peptidoglycan-binding protein [Jatrophihabitans sp.]|jgi:peptidoglycan hydrolase-like protein with peptidoglycan-binding domain|uniref:peptidoglycan-binding protein n=1 Tax=Jatrophihabitans sp. TaxID=1932789 RepID=UPI002E0A7D55|nr:peptidoglycan-binding protein [Jatrophihabitans sp.]
MRWSRSRSAPGSASSFFDEWTLRNATAAPGQDPRPHRRPAVAGAILLVAAAVTSAVLPGSLASADPSASTWYRLRMCESSNDYSTNTGNEHFGAYQFDLSTWRSVGGSGYPNLASKAEQDARALILYRERGWQPWQCAGILGLREDADARSGRISDIKVDRGGSTGTSAVPGFPGGSRWYRYGDVSSRIKVWQDQMHTRGYFPVGTGQYGPHTLEVVQQLQRLNGLVPNGYIGPNTWRLAWTGRYSTPTTPTPAPPVKVTPKPPVRTTIPAFPGGSRWYRYGDVSNRIKVWQDQMHKRGYFPVGTGQYGPHTLQVVEQLQRLNGLVPNGYIGPNTWRLAWTGKYRNP